MASYNPKKIARVTRLKAAILTAVIYGILLGGLLTLTNSDPTELPVKVKEWIENIQKEDTSPKPAQA